MIFGTVATHIAKIGVERGFLLKLLNQVSNENSVTAIYDRYDRWNEVGEVSSSWAFKLFQMIGKSVNITVRKPV